MIKHKAFRGAGVVRGSVGEVPCKRVPRPSEERSAAGRFTKGNSASLVHGRRSQVHVRALRDAAADAMVARREAIHADKGNCLSTVEADLVDHYLVGSCLLQWIERELMTSGPITNKGSRRALFTGYLGQLSAVLALAKTLGLERRSKKVETLAEVLHRAGGDRD